MPPKPEIADRFKATYGQSLRAGQLFAEFDKNSDTYKEWSVLSVNHIKDLSSKYMHEYLHFIVENTKEQLRSCMFAERDMSGDFIYVGNHKRLPSSAKDLPLPLRTLQFAKGKRPKVTDVLKILQITSLKGGMYKLATKNCWWYAGVVYKVLKESYIYEEQKWNISMIRSWLIATLRKKKYTAKAGLFDEERKEEWFDYIPEEGVAIQLVRKAFVAKLGLEPTFRKEYIGTLNTIGLVVDDQEAQNASKIAISEVDKPDLSEKTESQLDQDIEEFCSEVLAEKDADKLYESYVQNVKVKTPKSNILANVGKPQPTDELGRADRAEAVFAMIIVNEVSKSS